MSQVKAGSAYVEITARSQALIKGLNAAKRQLQDFGNATKLLGTQLLSIGTAASIPMAASIAMFTSFDDAIRSVRAVTQASEDDFKRLSNEAKRLGATTSYSASEVALLMTELGRAGFKPDQIIAMTGAVMDLARATGTDATLSAGFMSATIRQFGLAAEDATRVADGLTAAANKSFNSVESIGEALKYAAPVAADANMTLEETLAILGTLGNMGIQGSDAGTSLRRLLTLSAAEAERFQQVFGVATTDAAGNMRPLIDVLGEVAQATKELPTGQRGAKFAEVFGMLGITSASAIGKSVADTRVLLDEIRGAGGVASASAKQMESGIGGSFRILKSSLEGVAIAIGEALNDPLKRMVDAASGAFSAVIRWIEKNHQALQTFGKVALGLLTAGALIIGIGTAFTVAGSMIGGFLTTISFLGGMLSAAGALLAALLSPIGLVSVAVVTLGGYLVHASGLGGQAIAWLGERFQALKSIATASLGAIGRALASGDLAAAANVAWAALKLAWVSGINTLQGYWVAFKNEALSITDSLIYGIAGIISEGWAGIEIAWTETIGFLADTWSLFTGTLAKTWHQTVGFIKKAWVRLKGLFDSDLDVDAEVRRIDGETSAKTDAANSAMLGAIGQREQARKTRREEIERDRLGRSDALGQMRAADEQARRQAGDAAIGQAAADLAVAKDEWQAAIDAVGDAAEGMATEQPSPVSTAIEALKKSLAQSGETAAAEKQAIEGKSTFNAFAIRGLGADSLSDRALRAAEATAANTKKLISTIENAGLNYS